MGNRIERKGSLTALGRFERDAGRMAEIVRVLVKYRLASWMSLIPNLEPHSREADDRSVRDLPFPERVRLTMIELGTTFIKLGQMVSTRPDIFGPDLTAELSKLQTQTPPDPPELAIATIELELGLPLGELFAVFEPEPLASASIAQVHRAVLHCGDVVAVKVQKDGIQEKVEADLSILAHVAELAEKHSSKLQAYRPVSLVRGFRRTILKELDFTLECGNLEQFCRNFEGDPRVRFPRPYPELSSRRVLTMDLLDGVLGRDFEALRESGASLSGFADQGATVYLDMIFRDRFYHSDPHPGNLMVMPDGAVGILDCGMVGSLDEQLSEDFESLMVSIVQRESASLTDALWTLSSGKSDLGKDELQAELSELLIDSMQGSLSQLDLGKVLVEITAIIRRYQIELRPGAVALLRALMLLESTGRLLDPDFSLAQTLEPYYRKMMLERLNPIRLASRLQRTYVDWDRIVRTLPRDINETLAEIHTGKFRLKVEHQYLHTMVNRLVLGIVIAALFLGSSLLWSLKAPPTIKDVSVFGAIGYLSALVLSWLLYRAVKDSKGFAPDD